MSLVQYGSSDDDSDEEIVAPIVTPDPVKKKEPVRITVPSLNEFQDDTEPPPTKKLKPKGGSGLFSLLPPPKHTTASKDLTPHVLTKVAKVQTKTAKPPKPTATGSKFDKIPAAYLKKAPSDVESHDSDEDKTEGQSGSGMDFFSLEKTEDGNHGVGFPLAGACDLTTGVTSAGGVVFEDSEGLQRDTSIKEPFAEDTLPSSSSSVPSFDDSHQFCSPYSESEFLIQSAAQDAGSAPYLEDKEFKKLKGKLDMSKIEFVDVDGRDQLTGKDEWLMRSLTEEVQQPRRKGGMPTSQQRRKHQITYLAFQAKERELDLKNQWASNSQTRRETQAKYGF